MNQSQQLEIPIQPVDQPILCSPYQEPDRHWIYDTSTGEAVKILDGARRAIGIEPNKPVVCNWVSFKKKNVTICRW